MNNKTLETIQKTIARLETILEVDKKLSPRDIYCIQTAVIHLSYLTPYENPSPANTEEVRTD